MTAPGEVPDETSPLRRFERSMVLDEEKWRDGIGYDLGALRAASAAERRAIETLVLAHRPRDWRDVEALALLDTAAARAALRDASKNGDAATRMAVARCAPALISEARRAISLVRGLEAARPFDGLSEVLDEAAEFHPPEVVRALFRGTLAREGEVAVHYAALLLFLHGKAESAFDDAHRPFFLRFNTDDRAAREQALHELCARIGVDAAPIVRWARNGRRSPRGHD